MKNLLKIMVMALLVITNVIAANAYSVTVSASSNPVCSGSQVTLTANPVGPANYYTWKIGSTVIASGSATSYITPSPTATTQYIVIVNWATGGSNTDSITITTTGTTSVSSNISITAGNDTFCYGSLVTFSATCNYPGSSPSYQWLKNSSNISGANSSTYADSLLTDGNQIRCRITSNGTCPTNNPATSNPITVTVYAAPTATVTPSGSTTFCQGDSVVLSAPNVGGYTYQWRLNGNAISGATGRSYIAKAGGSYSVRIVNSAGCFAISSSTTVTVNTNPSANITPSGSTTFCQGDSVTLAANTGTGLSYVWKLSGSVISTATNYVAKVGGSYTVTVTNNTSSCFAISSPVTVTVNPLPTVSITPSSSTSFCVGDSVVLNANSSTAISYQWKKNGINISGATSTSYVAKLTGSYSVSVTNSSGCLNTASINVTENQPPNPTINGSQNLCVNSTQLYTTQAGMSSYSWVIIGATYSFTGQGNDSIYVSWTGTGYATIRVSYVNGNGCMGLSNNYGVTVNTSPSAPSVTSGSRCGTGTVNLSASTTTGNTIRWYSDSTLNNLVQIGTTFTTPSLSSTTTYWVVAKNSNNCGSTKVPVTATVNQFPSKANAGSDQIGASTCGLTSVTLIGNVPTYGTGTWAILSGAGGSFTNSNADTTVFSGTATTLYSIVRTITNSCGASKDTVQVRFNQNPDTAVAGPDQTGVTTCGLTTAIMAANSPTIGTGYWQSLNGGWFTNPTRPTTDFNGVVGKTYVNVWRVSTSVCGFSTDTMQVLFNRFPTQSIAGPDQQICGITSANLIGNVPNTGRGMWYLIGGFGTIADSSLPNSTFTGILGQQATLVWVITNPPCQSSQDTVVVKFNPLPNPPSATFTGNNCGPNKVTMSAFVPSGTIAEWYADSLNGSVLHTGNVYAPFLTKTTKFWVGSKDTITGCRSAVRLSVLGTIYPVPVPMISYVGNPNLCQGDSIIFTASPAGMTFYEWLSDTNVVALGTSYTITTSGNYKLRVTGSPNCPATSQVIKVMVNPLPNAPTLVGDSSCGAGMVTLTGTVPKDCAIYWYDTAGNFKTTGTAYNFLLSATSTFYGESRDSITGCKSIFKTSVTAVVSPVPTPSIVGLDTICSLVTTGYAVMNTPGSSYKWTLSGNLISGQGTDSVLVKFTNGGIMNITLTETNTFNCVGVGQKKVFVNPVPQVYLPDTLTIPKGGSVKLNPITDGIKFLWSPAGEVDNPNAKSPTATPNMSKFFKLTSTNSLGCGNSDSIFIISGFNTIADFWIIKDKVDLKTVEFHDASEPRGAITQWQWDFGDGSTDTVQNPTHVFAYPQMVTVRLIVKSMAGRYDTIVRKFHTADPTSVEALAKPVIEVYPNPSNGVFAIKSDREVSIEIYDLQGKNLVSIPKQFQIKIDISNFSKGIYLLRFSDGKSVQTEKIIIR